MPYLIVRGTYHIVEKRPDGDTISFRPFHQEHWLRIPQNRVPKINSKGDVSLRLEGIDALETHYRGESWLPEYHQPLEYANKALNRMLDAVGIPHDQVVWKKGEVDTAPDGAEGYIATNGVDPYHRVIAFAFTGVPPTDDGNNKFRLDTEHVKESVNFKLAEEGLVYPTFYAALYPDLRQTISDACVAARNAPKGLWAVDASTSWIEIADPTDLTPITERACIFPKLFRRLVTHLSQNGALRNFIGFLQEQNDGCVRIDNCEMATLCRFVRIKKNKMEVKLEVPPELLLFMPD